MRELTDKQFVRSQRNAERAHRRWLRLSYRQKVETGVASDRSYRYRALQEGRRLSIVPASHRQHPYWLNLYSAL